MSRLEQNFHAEMLRVYQREKAVRPHNAIRFLQMVTQQGGVGAAKALLNASNVSDGFTELYMRGRLDLTVEAVVLREPWRRLFTPDELAIAKTRLDAVGYVEPAAGAQGTNE